MEGIPLLTDILEDLCESVSIAKRSIWLPAPRLQVHFLKSGGTSPSMPRSMIGNRH